MATWWEQIGLGLPGVARRAIVDSLAGGDRSPVEPAGPRAPVFVTLRTRDGALRGCIGTLVAVEPDVVSETRRSAVLAARNDPRFPPVSATEVHAIRIEVTTLDAEEPVLHLADLDPSRYGVVVRDEAGHRGVLLPDIPGVDRAVVQVEIARRKAGITKGATVTLARFRVRKWTEEG